MSDDLSIQGEVVVRADKATEAFDLVADKAQAMATDVVGAAGKAGQAVDGIGAAAEKGAEKFTRAEGKIEASIKRATRKFELLGKTASQRIEFNISEKGLDGAKFEPLLAKLRETEQAAVQAQRTASGSLDGIGMSAKATAAAMRGVPAQFTDIVTSLQGGQRPLTVLLQQGGQLKDMFGGAGNAARALGTYVTGLVNPFTVLAAGVAAVGYAYYTGSQEAQAFTKSIVLSGNAAGVTASQLGTMTANVAKITGSTQGAAAEALAAVVQSGAVGSQNLEKFSAAAISYSKATGQAVGDTVKQFDELRKSPVEASLKLNDSTNYLTASLYRQIKALEEQGRMAEAAALAQTAYADAISSRASEIVNNLGLFERGWNAVAKAAKGALDDLKSIGRDDTLGQKITAAQAELDRLQRPGATTKRGLNLTAPVRESDIEEARARVESLREVERLSGKVAANRAAEAEQVKALAAFDKQGDEFKTKSAKRDEAVAKARIEGQSLIVAGLITEKDLRERIADINKKFAETGAAGTGQSEVAGLRAKLIEQTKYLDQLKTQGPDAKKATDGENQVIKIQEALKTSITGVARAEKLKALAIAESLAVVDRQIVVEQDYQKALKASEATLNSQIDAIRKQATSIQDQALGQEAVNANFGKSKTAIEQSTLALLKQQAVEADNSTQFAPAYVAALQSKIEAQERFVKALEKTEYKQASQRLTEAATAAAQETETLELQLSLIGRSQEERERIIAQRRVEIRLAKELATIEKLNLGDGPEAEARRAELRAQAAANAVVEGNNEARRVVLDGWQRTADSINQSLTDALLRGFESGKGFAENMRDTIVNMFKTLVLRPIISAVVNPVAGAISSAITGFTGGAGGSGGGVGTLLSSGSSLYSYGKTALGAVGGWLGLGGTAAATPVVGSTFTGAASNAAFNAANGAGMGASAGFAGIPVVGWIAMGMMASGEAYDKGFKYGNKGGEGYTVSDGGLIGPNGMVGGIDRILQGIGIDPKTAAILSGSALGSQAMYSVLGGYNVSNVGGGLSGTLTASGSSLQKRTDYTQDHRGFLGIGSYTTHNSEYSAADAGVTAYVDKGLKTVVSSVKTFAGMLGLSVDKIDGYSKAIDISLDGLKPEEQQAAIDKALTGFSDGLVSSSFGTSITSLSKEGETASQTMMRLGVDLQAIKDGFATLGVDVSKLSLTTIDGLHGVIDELVVVDSVFNTLGYTLFDVSAAGGAAAQGLAQAFGGLQSFQAQTAALFQNYYTPAEQRQQTYQSVADGLKAAGITGFSTADIAGASREQIRAVVDQYAGKIGTVEGDRQYAAIVAGANTLNPYVAGFVDPNKKPEPPRQEFGSSGGGGAASAANDVKSAWQKAADAIIATMTDIRSSSLETGPNSFAKLKAQFAIEMAQAAAGDLAAMQDIPALAKTLDAANKANSKSAVEQALFTSYILDSLGKVSGAGNAGGSLTAPNYTGVAAQTAPTQAYVPPAYIPSTAPPVSAGIDMEVFKSMERRLAAIEASNEKLRKMFSDVTDGGEHMNSKEVV